MMFINTMIMMKTQELNYCIYVYCNLPVNSRSYYSSYPQIIASGCSANTVINTALG